VVDGDDGELVGAEEEDGVEVAMRWLRAPTLCAIRGSGRRRTSGAQRDGEKGTVAAAGPEPWRRRRSARRIWRGKRGRRTTERERKWMGRPGGAHWPRPYPPRRAAVSVASRCRRLAGARTLSHGGGDTQGEREGDGPGQALCTWAGAQWPVSFLFLFYFQRGICNI
jgi:hypothetical protein